MDMLYAYGKTFKARDNFGDTIEISLDSGGRLTITVNDQDDESTVVFTDGQNFLAKLEMAMCRSDDPEFDVDELKKLA